VSKPDVLVSALWSILDYEDDGTGAHCIEYDTLDNLTWQVAVSDLELGKGIIAATNGMFALRFVNLPLMQLRGATLQMTNGSVLVTPTNVYMGVVRHQNAPPLVGAVSVNLGQSYVNINGDRYPVTFHDMGVVPFSNANETNSFNLWTNEAFRWVATNMANNRSVTIIFAGWNDVNNLTLYPFNGSYVVNTAFRPRILFDQRGLQANSDNEISVSDRRNRTRWFICPRCDFWYPITDAVRDGELPGLMVCNTGCADKQGRKDRPKPSEEREDRLWPRI
jgi:hypothetical protein